MSNNIDIENIIPCEICNAPIEFNNYIEHLNNCFYNRNRVNTYATRSTERIQPLDDINNFLNNMINHYQTTPVQYNNQNNPGNILLNQRTIRRTINHPNQPPVTEVQRYINEFPMNGSNIFGQLPSQLNLPNLNNLTNINNLNNNTQDGIFIRRTFNNNLNEGQFDNNFENNLENIFRNFLNNPIGILFTSLDTLTNFDELNNLEDVRVHINDINTVSQIINFNDIIEKDKDCAICLESFNNLYNNNNSIVFRKTICNHIYCNECLSTWLSMSKKCPLCSVNLEDFCNNSNNNFNNADNNLSDIDSDSYSDSTSNLENDNESNIIEDNDLDDEEESNLENNEDNLEDNEDNLEDEVSDLEDNESDTDKSTITEI